MKITKSMKFLISIAVLIAGAALIFNINRQPETTFKKKVSPSLETEDSSTISSTEEKNEPASTNHNPVNGEEHTQRMESELASENAVTPVTTPTFTDDNYENWMAMGAEFYSEKQYNPEKYKEGIEFLLNTLRYGNVDKMLSQAGGALFNIDDPELVTTYENILLDPDSNISPEGTLRILTLYIHKAPSTESESFKKVIEKHKKHSSVPVRHLAEKWPEFRSK
jgi:hypothetical protein